MKILHDLIHQTCRNDASIVYTRSCRIFSINSRERSRTPAQIWDMLSTRLLCWYLEFWGLRYWPPRCQQLWRCGLACCGLLWPHAARADAPRCRSRQGRPESESLKRGWRIKSMGNRADSKKQSSDIPCVCLHSSTSEHQADKWKRTEVHAFADMDTNVHVDRHPPMHTCGNMYIHMYAHAYVYI